MDVATATTAERRPIRLASVSRTIVVAFDSRAAVIGMNSCGPLVPTGISLSAFDISPCLAATGLVYAFKYCCTLIQRSKRACFTCACLRLGRRAGAARCDAALWPAGVLLVLPAL